MFRRKLCIVLLCLSLAGSLGCGKQEVVETTGPWGVTIEQIDLDDPENQQYIDWAKKRPHANTFEPPEYFSEWAHERRTDEEDDAWTYVWADKEKNMPLEKYRSWNKKKELVVRFLHKDDFDGDKELLVRDKASGKTVPIAQGVFDVIYDNIRIISKTRFIYDVWYWDGCGIEQSFVYDLETGDSICYWSMGKGLCDLGDEQYLWCDWNESAGSSLYLIDMRALEAEKKEAKRALFIWGNGYGGNIAHLSSDKRFVYVNLYYRPDNTLHRGVYDVETGEQVAFFEMPGYHENSVLIGDDMEYRYQTAGSADDPTILSFCIIHYDMEPVL